MALMRPGLCPSSVALALLVGALPVHGQDPDLHITMRAAHTVDAFAGGGPVWRNWHTSSFGVDRRFDFGSLGAGVLRTHRFHFFEDAFWLDAQPRLWRGAHGHLRGQLGRGAFVIPELELDAGVVQTLDGVEFSAAARRMRFVDGTVHVLGGGAGFHVGDWFLQARVGLVTGLGGAPVSAGVLARRSRAGVGFVEGFAWGGQELADLGVAERGVRRSIGLGARGRYYVTSRFAWEGHLSLASRQGVPDRRSISGAMIAHW